MLRNPYPQDSAAQSFVAPQAEVPQQASAPTGAIKLAPGETVKRQWPVTRPATIGTAGGDLYLTDSRLIFYGYINALFGRSVVVQEVHLQDVNGITAAVQRGMGVLGVLITIGSALFSLSGLFGLFAGLANRDVVPFTAALGFFVVSLIPLAACIWYIKNAPGNLVIAIHTRASQATPIMFGGLPAGPSGFLGRFFNMISMPLAVLMTRVGLIAPVSVIYTGITSSVQGMIAEIGAAVLEVQARGALADSQGQR